MAGHSNHALFLINSCLPTETGSVKKLCPSLLIDATLNEYLVYLLWLIFGKVSNKFTEVVFAGVVVLNDNVPLIVTTSKWCSIGLMLGMFNGAWKVIVSILSCINNWQNNTHIPSSSDVWSSIDKLQFQGDICRRGWPYPTVKQFIERRHNHNKPVVIMFRCVYASSYIQFINTYNLSMYKTTNPLIAM